MTESISEMTSSRRSELHVLSHAGVFGEAVDLSLKARLDEFAHNGVIRVADACTMLLVCAGIKPTCLVVLAKAGDCKKLVRTLREAAHNSLYVEVHFDPEVQLYYVILCRSGIKARFLKRLSTEHCSSIPGTTSAYTVTPSADYHLLLGEFLDVPECCLVPRPVMPEEADALFLRMRRQRGWKRGSSRIHYTSHLPCHPECAATEKIAFLYRTWLEVNCPDYACLLELDRLEKPLYLY